MLTPTSTFARLSRDISVVLSYKTALNVRLNGFINYFDLARSEARVICEASPGLFVELCFHRFLFIRHQNDKIDIRELT